jgi:hypothetical protein
MDSQREFRILASPDIEPHLTLVTSKAIYSPSPKSAIALCELLDIKGV